jgi:hypothetical protein
MANTNTAANKSKSVGDPCARYESLKPLWRTARGILNGQSHVKELDSQIDTISFSNILLPFSPSMTPEQYSFYKSEAELPGLTSQYIKVLVGGMLRKQPEITLPADIPAGCMDWLKNEFTSHNNSLVSFLDEALMEELQTSRAWVLVDYPSVPNMDLLTLEERKKLAPYPVMLKAESVINWRMGPHPITGEHCLLALVVRSFQQRYEENPLHPNYVDTTMVHRLNEQGYYVVDKYELTADQSANVTFINGVEQQDYRVTGGTHSRGGNQKNQWNLVGTVDNIMANNEYLTMIPACPLNGNITGEEPILMPLIDREVSLYNKVSRRNHLLLGAATYTPVVVSDMTDDQFEEVVSAGLGSWIKVNAGDDVKALETPSRALRDMEMVIQNTVNEMARLGIRMMAAEKGSGRDSGVSLEIRNAGQSALLASISNKVSQQMRKVVTWMINWKYGTKYNIEDVNFNLTPDLNPAPIGADWLRLVTEWYQTGIIPRSTFLDIAKANDIIDSDYDDLKGQEEINKDDLIMGGLDPQSMDNLVNSMSREPEVITNEEGEEDADETSN